MKNLVKHSRKLSKKSVMLLAIAAFALSTSSAFAQAQCVPTTTWIDGTGSWYAAANWNSGVPTSSINGQINNGGTAQVNSSLQPANACSLTLGYDIGNSGTVSLNSMASLNVTNSVIVGFKGTGTLTIAGGGAVTSGSGSIAVLTGQIWTSNGTVSVDAISSWAISGALSVGAGNATMGFGVTSTSTAHVNITVQGTATLAGNLVITFSGSNFTAGARYTLLTANGGRTGTFSNISYINIPSNISPVIEYDANHVYLRLTSGSL